MLWLMPLHLVLLCIVGTSKRLLDFVSMGRAARATRARSTILADVRKLHSTVEVAVTQMVPV